MNASTETTKAGGLSLTQTLLGLLKHYLGGRQGIIVLALAAAGAGLYFGWGWLAAAGIAPLLLTLAPCAAMCALGLCMNRSGGKPDSTDSKTGNPTASETVKQDEKR